MREASSTSPATKVPQNQSVREVPTTPANAASDANSSSGSGTQPSSATKLPCEHPDQDVISASAKIDALDAVVHEWISKLGNAAYFSRVRVQEVALQTRQKLKYAGGPAMAYVLASEAAQLL